MIAFTGKLNDVLSHVPTCMVLQFPKDTLDAVFDIVEQSTEKEGNLAFQALVRTYACSTTLECRLQCVRRCLHLCSM